MLTGRAVPVCCSEAPGHRRESVADSGRGRRLVIGSQAPGCASGRQCDKSTSKHPLIFIFIFVLDCLVVSQAMRGARIHAVPTPSLAAQARCVSPDGDPDRSLDSCSDVGNIAFCFFGPHNRENVFWHEHVSPQIEVQINASSLNRICQPLACSFRVRERESMMTAESQLVGVARLVVVSIMLSPLSHVD